MKWTQAAGLTSDTPHHNRLLLEFSASFHPWAVVTVVTVAATEVHNWSNLVVAVVTVAATGVHNWATIWCK